MGVTSGLVLYAVIWWLTFLVLLPIRVKTQGDLGEIVPGTHAGAPEVHNTRRKALWATGIAAVLWAVIATIILSELVTVSELPFLQLGVDEDR